MTPRWKEQLLKLLNLGKGAVADWRQSPLVKLRQLADKPGVMPIVLSLVCLITAMTLTNQYQIVIDGQVVGVVDDRQAAVSYVAEMEQLNKQTYGDELSLINDVRIARSFGQPAEDLNDLKILLCDRLSWGRQAAMIKVNGQDVVALADEATAQSVIDSIKQTIDDSLAKTCASFKQLSLNFSEQVEVVTEAVTVDQIADKATAAEILLEGKSSQTKYVVSRGDTLSGIASSRGVSVRTLTAANPGVTPTRLQIGQALNLTVSEPYVHVEETAEIVKEKTIPYTTRYIEESSMWNWQTKTITAGKNGKEQVTAQVTLVNGKVVSEQVLNSQVLSEPTQAVVKKGTKKAAVQGTGDFIWPTSGHVTSGYGWRWGKVHKAIDIGASQGTPIWAADSGTVVFAGYKGSYGYMVEIDHGNGYHTRYAHCSKLLVSKGQKVSQGQTIAKVGHTGFATGSHLHFEIIKNGTEVNPSKYFN